MRVTAQLSLDAEDFATYLEAAADVYHDDGCMGDVADEVGADELHVFTIVGNSSVIFALGQLYQQTGIDALCHYELL